MGLYLSISFFAAAVVYLALQILLIGTQSRKEPQLFPTATPFLDPAIGILRHKVNYLANFRSKYRASIHTLRLPFQRLYVVHAPHLIQAIQKKANAGIFIPNLLDFGMLFSGLTKNSQRTLRNAYNIEGNGFTLSVHKHLLSGPSLSTATRAAVDCLSTSVSNMCDNNCQQGLMELIQHDFTLALTGAIYGPENPYDDPLIEASWRDFVPGISHLLYSPFPFLTARNALQARGRVIGAFASYFRTGGHLRAIPMISEMFEINKRHGLDSDEAAKMEMATSLAMLSSGAITSFWLLFHLLSDADAMKSIRHELHAMIIDNSDGDNTIPRTKVLPLTGIKKRCPTLVALMNETFRFHSTVINIKQVQHDTELANQYLLKKDGIIMIPGQSVHHNTDIWGVSADIFDYHRFLSHDWKGNISSTSAFRPFGAGSTMCPGRHFSTNIILSLVAMIVLQYDIEPIEGEWKAPTKKNADLWNAMPKPDWDVKIRLAKRLEEKEIEWKFLWGDEDA
ncbi:cytochrome P450 [Pyrenochaeta sp. MPI-SDFR-AT-0127]|nr:cytochrome P450 [Pyrenochaeta sp. MPI-SDFR-AT-0127]